MKRYVLILSGLLFLCGCGGGKSSTPTALAISVSVTPSTQSTIDQGQTVAYTATVANDSSSKGVTWSMSGTGCSGTACGTFTNTSATAATYNAPTTVTSSLNVSVTATSVADTTKAMSSSVVVNPAPSITTTTLTDGTVGTAYSATLAASGGTGTLTWSLDSGSLPAGLTLASGAISGTPTAAGTSTFTVKVTDAAPTPVSVSQQLTLKIDPVALAITTTSLSSGVVNSAYSATLHSSGGTGTVTWTVSTGSLPAGLLLSAAGAISGTPTATGTTSFSVTATDSGTPAQIKTQALSIAINPALAITTTTLPGGTVSTSYSQTISASGGTLPVVWSVTSGALPAGLTLAGTSTASGMISGTPTATGSFSFTATAKDSSTPPVTVNQPLSIAIANLPLSISTTSLPNAVVGTPYSEPLQASGGTPPYTWTVASGSSLPTWLTIGGSGTSWTVSGTPTSTGPVSFTLTVTDSSSPTHQSVNQAFSFTINAASACSDSGSESLLTGQYAFILGGYTESGFLAAVGSFTADGTGKITAGVLDSNGTIVQSAASIDPTQSFYSVGSNHLGCATIVTSSGTFTTRLSVGGITSNVATAGRLVEWDSASNINYLTATGQIWQQTVPTNITSGNFVYEFTGVYASQDRTGVAGMVTIAPGSNGGDITYGEYDIDVEGVINDGNGLSTPYKGVTGSYTAPDPTTGRFTDATSLNGITAHHAGYLISGSQFLEMGTDALSSSTSVLAGVAKLQSGTPSFTTGSTLVYYATGTTSAELGLINVTGSASYTATYYEDVGGSPETTQTPSCTYTADTYGRIATSGSTCTMYLTTYSKMYPPVFYLSSPNTGVMLGTGVGVYAGQVEPQAAPSGGFSATSLSGAFYDGDSEVVNEGVSAEMIGVEALTFTGSGSLDIIGDYIGSYVGTAVTQEADQTNNTSLGTVNSNGTFSTNSTYGQINAIMISTTKVVDIDNSTQPYPIIQVIKQ
ncbi:MAG: beta strand repeat-containing protein [Terriglobia bacterium]